MDFTPASCTSCCHVNLSKNSFSNTPETHNKRLFLKASAKVRPLSEMAKEKPEKILEKWKTHYFWKPQIAETYYIPRKKKNTKYKERNNEKKEKCRPHRKKTCGEAGKAQKKPAKHVTSRHIISCVVIIYRSCYVITYRSRYDLRLHQA